MSINLSNHKRNYLAVLIFSSIFLAGCNHDDDDDPVSQLPSDDEETAMYDISVTNITNGQPLTPVAVVVHDDGFTPWRAGMPASAGLEVLAESGDNSMFITDSESNDAVIYAISSIGGPFGPGGNVSMEVDVTHSEYNQISIVSMLANTNDAFTGVANWDIGSIAVNQSVSVLARVYDAGTEANSESAGSIPGPADGGEGYNATRNDSNSISVHRGVVTSDDGLMTSVLDESHRWLGPAAKITITRIE